MDEGVDEAGTAPRNDVERTLARIWCEVLGLDTVGVFDDFTDLGGHSLLAVAVSSAVTSQLHVDLGVRDIERWPTIAEQAGVITRALAVDDGVPTSAGAPAPALPTA